MSAIRVTVREVYGRLTIYPANGAAETLARIAGTKTLSARNLKDAQDLGLTVECTSDYGRWLNDALKFSGGQPCAA